MDVYRNDPLAALGDPTRRAIVERLFDGPQPVGELAKAFPISRPAISFHLRILKEANLVADRAVGTKRLYSLNPQGFELLRDYFDRFWTQALNNFKNKLESEDESK